MDVLVSRLNALGAENAARHGKVAPASGKSLPKRSGTCSPPVVLTKADLEKLRCHADLPPVGDIPRDHRLGANTGSQASLQPSKSRRARSTGSNAGNPFAPKEPRACSATPEPRERPPRPPRLSRGPHPGGKGAEHGGRGAALRAAGTQSTSGELGRPPVRRDANKVMEVISDMKGGSRGQVGSLSFELCGVDPRRGAAASNAGGASSSSAAALVETMASPSQGLMSVVGTMPSGGGSVAGGLGIMGQPLVYGSSVLTVATFEDQADDDGDREPIYLPWSDDEEENAKETCSDTEFDYREFRYRMPGKEIPESSAPQPARGRSTSRRPRPERKEEEGRLSDIDIDSPWSRQVPRQAWGPGSEIEESPETGETEMDGELLRICKALSQFYGLPDKDCKTNFNVMYGNCCAVDDEAWCQRTRNVGVAKEPPHLWIRGGRVYDFYGDRGTIEEVENDLLVREVEDIENCRLRRKEQGLMPYPFVPIPLRHEPGMDPEARSELRRQQEKAQGDEPKGRRPPSK
eukprot:gnl/MRDRNA2_/MRDRNA2_33624_c0_seq1.p1 gnl/MRDRNA2_/MRDRNA2_33624_c0~~gnl/MRDRNA2_/MRDRNA2_33624_c0_seq1.p1  ORF type:complete len:519 (+),score=100.35 gnl/MRDRNA2_/MRDRNA2_33624_c0_seq1:3-1559(+)